MNDTELKLVAVATEIFAQYGVKRTSMGEIAECAGVSRQTLYSFFNSKDKLLAVAMQSIIDEILSDLERDWKQCESVEQILDIYFKHSVYKPFEMLRKTPDIKDLIHGVGDETRKVAHKADTAKTKLLAQQLEPFRHGLEARNSDPVSVARLIVTTTRELKLSVNSRKELEKLLQTLKKAVQALVEK